MVAVALAGRRQQRWLGRASVRSRMRWVTRVPECDREGAVPRACPACQVNESLSRAFVIWPDSRQAFVYYECTAGRCHRRWTY